MPRKLVREDVADIIDKAADYIDEHGWIRGRMKDEDGRVCTGAACKMVIFGQIGWPASSEPALAMQWRRYKQVMNTLFLALDHVPVTMWNDQRMRRSTKKAVVKRLHREAARVRSGEVPVQGVGAF